MPVSPNALTPIVEAKGVMTRPFQLWTQDVNRRVADGWRDITGEITVRSVMTFMQAGNPLASARSRAGTRSSGSTTCSP